MNAERHQRLMDLLGEALEREPESRAAWTEAACAGDQVLRNEVMRLLAQQTSAAQFLEESPLAAALGTEKFDSRSLIGERIGLYKIISEIGRGGMGAVYLAERDDQQFTRRVALKLIKRGMDTDFVVQRFRNERQILASLDHPNIAGLIDGGATEADLPYFIMEYVEGQPITEYANKHSLTTAARLKLFRTVCSAVQYAHQNLVIHRDLKPSNILVTNDGEPKLLDFGIAKLLQADGGAETELTATAIRVMTPEYASPEQVKGERVTTATDVYSLGVLLYELLTGRRPYRVKSRQPEEIAKAICEQEPEKPSNSIADFGLRNAESTTTGNGQPGTNPQSAIPDPKFLRGDLDNIVLKALRKEPQRRYASVEQFSEDIRRHLEGLPVSAREDTLSYRTSKFVQRNKIGVAAAAIVMLALLGGITVSAWEAHQARIEGTRAQQRFNEVRALAHTVLFDYHDAIASLPGSTPVRERLVNDALKYLDDLGNDPGNSQSLQRELATAYLRVGDVQGRPYTSNLGQTNGALASYQKALAILERLSASSERNNELTRDLATVYERIGNVQLRKGNGNDALDRNNRALGMRQALLATDPSNKQYRREVADSYLYIADALQATCVDLKCMRTALDDQRQALDLRQALAREDPSDVQIHRDIAQAYARIGWRLELIGHQTGDRTYLRESLENDEASLRIRKELAAANPTNAFDHRNLADQLMLTGNAQLANGDLAAAFAGYRDSLDIFKALSAADPTNSEARRDLSFVYFRLAAAYGQAGDGHAARENYAQLLRIDQELLAKDATNVEDRQNIYGAFCALSELSRKTGDQAGAIENWRKAVAVSEEIVNLGPDTASHLYTRAITYLLMGNLLAESAGAHVTNGLLDESIPPPTNAKQAQELREATTWFQKSLDAYQEMKSKGTLSGADASKPEGVAREIAKCDLALHSK